jgi:hypothetical protein
MVKFVIYGLWELINYYYLLKNINEYIEITISLQENYQKQIKIPMNKIRQ